MRHLKNIGLWWTKGSDNIKPHHHANNQTNKNKPKKNNAMKSMFAKFSSVCASSGKPIKKGQLINYDPRARKAYLPDYTPENGNQDEDNLRGYIEAQEQAYFDNQYRR